MTTAPPAVLNKPVGTITFGVTPDGPALFLRTSAWAASAIARVCRVDLALSSWSTGKVTAVLLMVRLMRSPEHTYCGWIDCGNERGLQALRSLGRKCEFPLLVVSDEGITRRILTHNMVHRFALTAFQQFSRNGASWSTEDFDEARKLVDQKHPTVEGLWNACVREEAYDLNG